MLKLKVPSVREGQLPVILQNTCRWKCVLYIDVESFMGKSVDCIVWFTGIKHNIKLFFHLFNQGLINMFHQFYQQIHFLFININLDSSHQEQKVSGHAAVLLIHSAELNHE